MSGGVIQLAYRLYTLCERANSAEYTQAFTWLIISWGPIERVTRKRNGWPEESYSNAYRINSY